MDVFPTLTSKRLTLGELRWQDISRIVEYAGNEKIAATTLNIPHPFREEHAIAWIYRAQQGFAQRDQFVFGIYLQTTGEFIGDVGLYIHRRFRRGALGFWIAEPFWGQGYATEAVGAVIRFGFDTLNMHKIVAAHFSDNPASGRVLAKNGMVREGEFRDHVLKRNTFKDVIQHGLVRS